MGYQKLPWSSPYKTKLWLFGSNSDMFCKKELELWEYIAGFGPRGCRDTNPQLSVEIGRCKRTIQFYLRNLESHALVETIPGWAELVGSRFVKPLRYRRIIALPWPSKRVWMRESIRRSVRKWGAKNCALQRRLSKREINKRLRSQYRLFTEPLPDTGQPPEGGTLSRHKSPAGETTSPS